MRTVFKRTIFAITLLAASTVFSSEQPTVKIIYPKNNAVVGNKVNVVLDPTDISYFRVTVNKDDLAIVDTSSGTHAAQGVLLQPGLNSITVTSLVPSGGKGSGKFTPVASGAISVLNRDGYFSTIPAGFTQEPFHTRERESTCSSCHRLEVNDADKGNIKPQDMMCYVCHREIPSDRHIHGPAAVWNCLACHNPELYPAKYAFSLVDPWKVSKYTQTVEPVVFTIGSEELFKPGLAIITSKPKAKELLAEAVAYLGRNPGDRMRLEVHTDNVPLKQTKNNGKLTGFKTNQALTNARAKALAGLLKENGVPVKRVLSVGMAEKLPKTSNTSPEGRSLNNRVEIVIYPSDVKVLNSQKLPVLKDRTRVLMNIEYSQGPQISKLRVVERIPKGFQYVKGSGSARGRAAEPKTRGNELIWEIGGVEGKFSEGFSYVLKRGKDAEHIPMGTMLVWVSNRREQSREFDSKVPAKQASTVIETCLKCHSDVLYKKFKHGPVDAGYCNLCHDPHASRNHAWLRKPVVELCTTCHAELESGVHVVAGFATGKTHPVKRFSDPLRPGRKMSCTSCHNPHSAETNYLFAYGSRSRQELCGLCHGKK